MKLKYSVQLSSISLLPPSLLSSPRDDPSTPPFPWNGIHHCRQVHQGCPWMPPPWRLPMQIACIKVIVVLIADGGGGRPRQPCIPPGRWYSVRWTPEQQSCPQRRQLWGRIDFLWFGGWLKSGGWDKVQLGKHQTLVWVRMIRKILNWHCFLRDKHTTFYMYYMWAQSDKVVSVSASIRRPS